ncbi:HEPN family nuclease [Geomonas anaerohicana]|uniref:pEK499-p136 HEPN domain-containing protein n=1 Tax=Geomonas anaerohicana TaxID=2798583 RepID=A0ABS0YF86_9BACT|nr:HEPN family nuclease [Geomonas anaerohicana]MBJ6750983.1 hypothetical protein [Geomonas anaerohicana]
MMYEELVADFAKRTRQNLETLRLLQIKNDSGLSVFEVTQLINSMLGLLVFPQQRYFDEIPNTPLKELAATGWPIPRVVGDYRQPRDLRMLLRLLRNAVSHFNIEFLPDNNGEISGLRVWNTELRKPFKITWMAELSIDDLEKITDRFIALLLKDK